MCKFLALALAILIFISCGKEKLVVDVKKDGEIVKENALAKETSPYLLQHKNNPVDWLPWGQKAFALAEERDVPVIVSIGYSTCHWCHVMEHEVFENKDIAKMMNKWFVCVKVDREEHPDVDDIYMSALHAMRERGGWPLNVIVTPQKKPFFGGTYFPAHIWTQILTEIHKGWVNERDKIENIASQLHLFLKDENKLTPGKMPATVWSDLEKDLVNNFDQWDPAWSSAPKFPSSQMLRLVLLLKEGAISKTLKKQALDILTTMQDSGLHDLVGGGFHRYSVDAQWRVPHFEKMLYDNALLATAYFVCGAQYSRQDLTHTGRRVLDYLLRDMRVQDKEGKFLGYAAAEDADDPGGEGSFYAWNPKQLQQVLGEKVAEQLAQDWNIHLSSPSKNHLGHLEPVASHIPFPRGMSMQECIQTEESIKTRLSWEKYYPKLLEVRSKRPRPGLDYKVLTAWNGLALSAFAHGACLTGDTRYLQATRELVDAMKLRHSAKGLMRLSHIKGFINDYGFLLCGLMDAYNALGDPKIIHFATAIVEEAIERFSHPQGGFYATEERKDLIRRSQIVFDNAYPAGNSSMALGLVQLAYITGEEKYSKKAQAAIELTARYVSKAAISLGTLLTAYLSLKQGAVSIVVTGQGEQKQKLLSYVRNYPTLAIIVDIEKAQEEKWPLLEGRKEIKEAMVLFCAGQTCLAPAKTEEEIKKRFLELQDLLKH